MTFHRPRAVPLDAVSGPVLEPPAAFRGVFRTDLLARAVYADGAGIARALPAAVAVPEDVEDASALVAWARRTGAMLMPRGSGSGMAGGAVGPGVLVDLSRFLTVAPVDVDARTVRVGAGVLRGTIDAAARAVGLRFPVDPSSGAFCTIGGMVGANAAGARTFRFGATRAWVRGLQCVFDDGQVAWVRRDTPPPMRVPAVARLVAMLESVRAHASLDVLRHAGVLKESSGYGLADALDAGGDLVDLLVGSEGTLALFTAVEVALCPVAAATGTVLASFASLDQATACAMAVRDNATTCGVSACELLDRTFLDIAATGGPTGIPSGTDAVLLMEVEGDDASAVAAALEAVITCARRAGAVEVTSGLDAASQHRLWALRHAASPILAQLAPRLRSMQFIEDGCVPPDRFPAYVRGVRAALDRADIRGVIFGHAGDAHAHVNPLLDVTVTGWRDRMHALWSEVTALTASLGGTLAGEHGDGRLRVPRLADVWSVEARAAFANCKAAGDPAGVFNVGCKVADAGGEAPVVLRHDPEAAPLPPAVQEVLAQIERTRTWATFRLDALQPR